VVVAEQSTQPLAAVHFPGGRRASTYAHLLSGEPGHGPLTSAGTVIEPDPDRVAVLEEGVKALRCEVAELHARFEALETALGGPGLGEG